MLERIIRAAISHRWLTLVFALAVAALGLHSYSLLPIDAVPDITNVQVQINTEAPGYSPQEVERLLTYPIENALAGLARLDYTRSISRYGLSQVTVVSDRKVELDGTVCSLTAATRKLLGLPDDYPLQPSPHWTFNGQSLKALYEAVHDGGE